MCLLAFNWRPEHITPLILVANRDEFHDRPALPIHWWPDKQGNALELLAGQDLKAQGTWLGFNRAGRFAFLTNIRPGFVGVEGARSRGDIPLKFLNSNSSIQQIAHSLKENIDQYAGFNLIVGEPGALYWMSSNTRNLQPVEPGVHALSNDALDTPWPKVILARQQMSEYSEQFETRLDGSGLLMDSNRASDIELPDTGIPLEWERLLSSQLIISEDYGTRSRCLFRVSDGQYDVVDQQLNKSGVVVTEQRFSWAKGE